MSDKNGDTIRGSDGQGGSLLGRNVSIGFSIAKPSLPAAGVYDDPGPVYLPDADEASGDVGQLALERAPTTDYLGDGLGSGQTESPGVARGGEGPYPPTLEVGDDLLRDFRGASVDDRQRE